jgi:uncharacterized protein (TIRG00374 family)
MVCYTALAFFGKGGKFWESFRVFPLTYLPLLLGLALMNYCLRFLRWQIYLNALGISLKVRRSFLIFMAGLTMTVTPGKAGEALKAYYLNKEENGLWTKGLSIVFAERLTDLLGVVILVGLGLTIFPHGIPSVLLGSGVSFLLLLWFLRPGLFQRLVYHLRKVPAMKMPSESLLEIHANIRRLVFPSRLLLTLLISCGAWFSECLVLHVALLVNRTQFSLFQSTFVYALSTLAGALSLLPGGLVATEGSMTGLLLLSGLKRIQAVSLTFVVRLCTLWFAVFLGMIAFFVLQRTRPEKEKSVGFSASG